MVTPVTPAGLQPPDSSSLATVHTSRPGRHTQPDKPSRASGDEANASRESAAYEPSL